MEKRLAGEMLVASYPKCREKRLRASLSVKMMVEDGLASLSVEVLVEKRLSLNIEVEKHLDLAKCQWCCGASLSPKHRDVGGEAPTCS